MICINMLGPGAWQSCVTELVINALKHAFPHHRHGRITVGCEFHGPNWVLAVADDGIGMPTDPAMVQTGLGTNIVQAPAKQLHARVEIVATEPGTRVTITHDRIVLVGDRGAATGGAAAADRQSGSGK